MGYNVLLPKDSRLAGGGWERREAGREGVGIFIGNL